MRGPRSTWARQPRATSPAPGRDRALEGSAATRSTVTRLVAFVAAASRATPRFRSVAASPRFACLRAEADAASDFARFLAECQASRDSVAALPLEHTFLHPIRHHEMNLRWVYLHMLEEYARHNGHADLIRERIDGATGQ